MSEIDVDMIAHGLCADARTIAGARPDQLARHLDWLEAAQDDIALAIEKARSVAGGAA